MKTLTSLTTFALLACVSCTVAPAQHPQAASVKNANAEWGRKLASRLRMIQEADIDSICIRYTYVPPLNEKEHSPLEKTLTLSAADSQTVLQILRANLQMPENPCSPPKILYKIKTNLPRYFVTLQLMNGNKRITYIDTRALFPHMNHQLQIQREAQYQIHAIMLRYFNEAKLKLPADYLRTTYNSTPCNNCGKIHEA